MQWLLYQDHRSLLDQTVQVTMYGYNLGPSLQRSPAGVLSVNPSAVTVAFYYYILGTIH